MIMKYFFRLFFLLMTIYSFGQFNTITYPIEQKYKKEHLHQSFSISTPQKVEEKKEVSTPKKAKRTTKSDL